VFAIFFPILVMRLCNGSGRSVLIVALFHSAFKMTNVQKITLELLLLPGALASLIPAVAPAVLVMLVVVFTRGRLSYELKLAGPRPAEAEGVTAQPRVQ
jgi:hypothetical protein